MARKRHKPMSLEQWREITAAFPPGHYAVYGPMGEREGHVRGYLEAPCGSIAIVVTDPWDRNEFSLYCPGCHPHIRLELIRVLE